jgi:acyl-CoA thioesterase YciA
MILLASPFGRPGDARFFSGILFLEKTVILTLLGDTTGIQRIPLPPRRNFMIDEPVQLPQKQPVVRLVPMPRDENMFGDIFGGWIMSHVDVAGGIEAMRYARGRVATVAVNSFHFQQPVSSGDVVSFYADIVEIGKTSITVAVRVFAERHPHDPVTVKVTEATLTYVAIDESGRKRELFQQA